MLAYLAMMAPRVVELRRVLKPTGSLYLHCDSTASHYLKMLLDAVFGPMNFRSEITWNPIYLKHSEEHVSSKYRADESGRFYTLSDRRAHIPGPT
jgi:adenine specific DNA methylase Mod